MKISKGIRDFFSPDAFRELFSDGDRQSSFASIVLQMAGVIISMFVVFYYMHQLS